jgi:parallel beta-helix repeat protein
MNRTALACTTIASLTLASTALLLAGPLSPPGGPISSTYKTLADVEPRNSVNAANTPGDGGSLFKITQSGSYYLTGNITGISGKAGIVISANDVTLDLRGFDFIGVSGSQIGIQITGTNVSVINGTVRAWGQDGINAGSATIGRFRDLTLCNNSGSGLVTGAASVVSHCVAASNGGSGILGASGCTISCCAATSNSTGINATSGGCTIVSCTATNNLTGLGGTDNCTLTDCTVTGNTGHGIVLNNGGTVHGCTVTNSGGPGITVASACTVSDCNVSSNAGHGIFATGDNLILSNNCTSNGPGGGGAGISVSSTYNVVEGNRCSRGNYGIQATGQLSIFARNFCVGNGNNFSLVASNASGPIIQAILGSAISGNSYSGGLGSSDPNASFTGQ